MRRCERGSKIRPLYAVAMMCSAHIPCRLRKEGDIRIVCEGGVERSSVYLVAFPYTFMVQDQVHNVDG